MRREEYHANGCMYEIFQRNQNAKIENTDSTKYIFYRPSRQAATAFNAKTKATQHKPKK